MLLAQAYEFFPGFCTDSVYSQVSTLRNLALTLVLATLYIFSIWNLFLCVSELKCKFKKSLHKVKIYFIFSVQNLLSALVHLLLIFVELDFFFKFVIIDDNFFSYWMDCFKLCFQSCFESPSGRNHKVWILKVNAQINYSCVISLFESLLKNSLDLFLHDSLFGSHLNHIHLVHVSCWSLCIV